MAGCVVFHTSEDIPQDRGSAKWKKGEFGKVGDFVGDYRGGEFLTTDKVQERHG